MPKRPDHPTDDAVEIIRELDSTARARLHRLAHASGVHPVELAASLLSKVLEDDERENTIPPEQIN